MIKLVCIYKSVVMLVLLLLTSQLYAQNQQSPGNNADHHTDHNDDVVVSNMDISYQLFNEKQNTGWALYFDNDVLLPGGTTDRDYTGGFSFTLSGVRSTDYLLSIDGWRNAVTDFLNLSGFYRNKSHFNLHSFSFGMTLFTPADISVSEPVDGDHPYASFFYITNSQQVVVPQEDIVYISNLSVGFLGLKLAEVVQTQIHEWTDSIEPMGWDNQISAGGELTAKYSFGVQKIISRTQAAQYARHELKLTSEANIGFITNASVGFNWRWGRLTTPWWSFVPHLSDYINMGVPVVRSTASTARPEFYVWLGGNYQLHVYNAILQGQFRDSEVTFSNDQLERYNAEISMGVVREFTDRIRVSLFYRHRSAAVKLAGAPDPTWGGVTVSKSF